jgi:hypothetical protein
MLSRITFLFNYFLALRKKIIDPGSLIIVLVKQIWLNKDYGRYSDF